MLLIRMSTNYVNTMYSPLSTHEIIRSLEVRLSCLNVWNVTHLSSQTQNYVFTYEVYMQDSLSLCSFV